jgi:signal transduction histidine kinase
LSSNNSRCLTEDLAGNIYIGTVRGVDRLNPETGNITHYTVADGLAADFVRAAFRDHQGALWFGTLKGLSRLDPQPERALAAPLILINGLQIAGVKQPLAEFGSAQIGELTLNAAQNNLQIDFFSLSLEHAEQLRYQYRLEGADVDWSAPTDQRTVTYANLAPGHYRFMVRALSADGITSAQPAFIEFRILRPIWQRWWFLTLALMAGGFAAFMLYRYRVRQLLALEHVRTRIASDLHDDIGASLSRMAILSEVVKRQDEIKSGASARMLTEIADSARSLVDAMSDIVWSIDPHRDDLRSVTARIRQFASDVLEARGIKWDLQLPRELAQVRLNAEQRRHILLIFKEALNNVVRHADCATVTLSLSCDGRSLMAEILDDGRGFQPPQAEQANGNGRGGNGLKNMRARVAQLGGELDITSSPDAGTHLRFKVPLK